MDTPELSDPNFQDEEPTAEETTAEETTSDEKRSELIKLSEDGEVSQSVKYLKKATNKIIDRVYMKYERKQADQASAFLADTLITKFGELMSGLDVVASDDGFTKELRNDKLLKKNIKSAVRFITPFIPFIGIITGGVILGKHVLQHRNTTKTEEEEQQ